MKEFFTNKIYTSLALLLVALLLGAGCGSSGSDNLVGGGVFLPRLNILYVRDGASGSSGIASFLVDPATGEVQFLARTAQDSSLDSNVGDMQLHPNGNFLYTTHLGDRIVVTYQVNNDGTLNELAKTSTTDRTRNIGFTSDGSLMFVTIADTAAGDGDPDGFFDNFSSVDTFTVNPSTGSLAFVERELINGSPQQVMVSNDDTLLFVTELNDRIFSYTISPTGLTPVGTTEVGSEPEDIFHHPTLKVLYTMDELPTGISQFTYDSQGNLSLLSPRLTTVPGVSQILFLPSLMFAVIESNFGPASAAVNSTGVVSNFTEQELPISQGRDSVLIPIPTP